MIKQIPEFLPPVMFISSIIIAVSHGFLTASRIQEKNALGAVGSLTVFFFGLFSTIAWLYIGQ